MASSGKPLGEPQLAVPPGPNIILLSGMREETNDHVGSGLHDHSYLVGCPCRGQHHPIVFYFRLVGYSFPHAPSHDGIHLFVCKLKFMLI